MYLQGEIVIDPSQLTEIHHVRPTKGFARVAHLLTGGLVKSKEERETFLAISILQQINVVMRSVGVDNIVRLAKDDVIIYEDTEGNEGDLKHALDEFASQSSANDNRLFDTLQLVLEHRTDDLGILIDIDINRTHDVGDYPIMITVNGLANDLGAQDGEDHVRKEMEKVFSSQSSYDEFVNKRKESFLAFLSDLADAFSKHMSVDDVQSDSSVRIIRPRRRVDSPADVPESPESYHDPVYDADYGYEDSFFYAWLWSDHCHAHDILCREVTVVDAQGDDVFKVGEEGFQAGEGDTMNVDADFVLPETSDIHVLDSHDYGSEVNNDRFSSVGDVSAGSDGGGWFSSISDSLSSGFDFGGDGGGGSSCGGGCGGG